MTSSIDRQCPVTYWERGAVAATYANVGDALREQAGEEAEVAWDVLTGGELPAAATHVYVWRVPAEPLWLVIGVVDLPRELVVARYMWAHEGVNVSPPRGPLTLRRVRLPDNTHMPRSIRDFQQRADT